MSDILKVKSGNSWIGIPAITGSPGSPGTPGSPGPAGPGVAEGGTAGQLLKKSSSTDYDTEWGSISASDIGAASIDLGITGATAGNYAKVKTVDGSGKPTSWEYGTMTGGTSDYSDLTNKPQIEGVTLSGNKTAADLGLAKSSDIPSVPVQSVNSKTGAVVLTASDVGAGTYSKPSGGIPSSDLANAVQTSLGAADTAYQKPSTGIPATDLASAVQTSLGAADTAYQKPLTGIPASDLASGVIPTVPAAYTSNPEALGTASSGSSTSWARGDHVHPKPTASDIGAATVDLGISGTTVGKIIKVLTVDGSGKPTSWEAVSETSPAVTVLTPQETTLTLQPCPVTYKWGEVSALTLTVTATSQYHFMFSCPIASTTALTINGETGRAGDEIEAGNTYEVDIWGGVTFIKAIEITAVT